MSIVPILKVETADSDEALVQLVLNNVNTVFRKYTEKRRQSKLIDQLFDRHLSRAAKVVNDVRKETALKTGKTTFAKVEPTDILKGIYKGDQELTISEYEMVKFANQALGLCGVKTYIGAKTAMALHAGLATAYAEDPENSYMSLDDLKPADLIDAILEEDVEVLEEVVNTVNA